MENINIAVIGAAGVGKSTLIQRALGLRSLPTAVASSLKMVVDNFVYTVSLVELDLESFDFDPDRLVQWPKQINGQIVPRMDGALLLYDVMNRESIADLPQTLSMPRNSRSSFTLSSLSLCCRLSTTRIRSLIFKPVGLYLLRLLTWSIQMPLFIQTYQRS